ncbi:calpain-1 catalytic subunit-like [Chanos chanos]|uniref:Calpain-1 catalytic subunit-like n=1 Tax=Chanos chanos TaxID=29144 RepID=A0A6J2WG54_CHACN|nr:calpain-1 catalytic subunit-like [Chanos chanos]
MPPPGVCLNIMNERHKKNGVGSMNNPVKFLDQDYNQLLQYSRVRNVRYIDEMFPPDRRSIGDGVLPPEILANVQWIRPSKLVQDPYLFVEGMSRFDFAQGALGNCWFLASIGALTFQKDILRQVIPGDQSFQDNYFGLFHFRFWRFGEWVDVVIDDKLPTVNGQLVFVRSKTPNEFWPALLEKAYAKVCGSYADMNAGTCAEALMDFTGGVHMTFNLKEAPSDLWDLMYRAAKSQSLMGCGTPQGATPENTVLPNGIVEGHAYTVTGVTKIMSNGMPVELVRLFNPWGRGEWNGDWGDHSPRWQTVSVEDRAGCLKMDEDGEFWMSMEDFIQSYSDLDICCRCPDFLDGNSSCHWTSKFHDGRWVAGITAGGCMNHTDTFWTNPQYYIKLDKLDDHCEETQGQKNILVTLMQKPDKRNRRLVSNLHIGFSIFQVSEQFKGHGGKLPAAFFYSSPPVAQSKAYLNAREVMEFFSLKPGEYIIVPSTFKPNETASFILGILSKAETHLQENSGSSMVIIKPTTNESKVDGEEKVTLFRQYSDQYEEVDAEQLQKLLNEKLLGGYQQKTGGFGLDSCRSMVAMMDLSVTGTLSGREFLRLWNRVATYKDIFFRTDTSKDGMLNLNELRNALGGAGMQMSDGMLNLMALRYGGSSGQISLENFICLVLRMDCMAKIFKRLNDGEGMYLVEHEWMYLSMYT